MINYLKSIWTKIKEMAIWKKILLILLSFVYIFILCICFISVEVDSTSPGSVSRVSNTVHINSDNAPGEIYTVSVYAENKVSLLEYFFRKQNDYIEISKGKSVTYQIFTENEEYLSNVGYKNQSIQDSIILAYTTAKNKGYDVALDYEYRGEYLIHLPNNAYKTSSTDFKNGDVVIKYNNTLITDNESFTNCLKDDLNNCLYEGSSITEYYETGKYELYDNNGIKIDENIQFVSQSFDATYNLLSDNTFTVLRNGLEVEVKPSRKMEIYLLTHILKIDNSLYSISETNFSYYNVKYEKATPSIDLSKSTSVGPSGGLMQTIAVYNAITATDVTKGKRIMGTGGITLDGKVTAIGGEQQKVVTANLYLGNVFFVPQENYKNAKAMFDKLKDCTMELVPVETFNDALEYLERME